MIRLFTLDYLRGLAALSILIYHFYSWQGVVLDGTSFLGRIGLYGVSIFYILSGLTLYYVYKKQIIDNKFSLKHFFIKRIARIHPLLIATTIASLILYKYEWNAYDLLLNVTGIFGFIKWDTYYATGAWSIGNELTFYALFPILIVSIFRNKYIFYTINITIIGIAIYFSVFILPAKIDDFWRDYINPLNQVIYFTSGVVLGYVIHKIYLKQITIWLLLTFSILVLIFFPTSTDKLYIISGYNRFVFFGSCILLVACVYKLTPFNSLLNKPLVFLGEISYSLYLIHPLVYKVMGVLNDKYNYTQDKTILLISIIIMTIIASWISYQYFEKPAMKMINSINQRT